MTNDQRLVEYLKKLTVELHESRNRVRELEQAGTDPVVVVGMGCRLPGGVVSPEGLWELVSAGGDAIEGFPSDRGWDLEGLFDPDPERSGTSYVREGGFLRGAGDFDARFFGISPREALAMDPQQRLLLEVSWEALERAGIAPDSLRGSDTGVFTGLMYHDYLATGGTGRPPEDAEGYYLTGTTGSVASGRISYLLGMQGPALTVDTACSSSLVAMHLAVQSLRRGECSLALAGGVTVMSGPEMFVEFSRQRGLAPDGRCKPFAAGADGTAWSEGVGVLVLERLSDARRAGHSVLAVVAGTAVNQDGASNGLTAPHGPSQERVIRSALADAGWDAGSVDVVEAHGTGTRLGDPIEAQALLRTYGQGRGVERPLWLGSLKSNIGHAQAAAGVAGVIKTVMAMRHGVLAPTVHVDAPTPHVDWSQGQVRLLTEAREWPATTDRPRRAGVSSFGVSGTNAHVLLEEPPRTETVKERPVVFQDGRAAVAWPLATRSREALPETARRLAAHVRANPATPVADTGLSLATTRSALEHRAVVTGRDRDRLLRGLDALAAGDLSAAATGTAAEGPARVVFVFPGQGSHWIGMAAELMETCPEFAKSVTECADALEPFTDWSLTDVLRGYPSAPPLERVDVVQPAVWAVMVSLAALWRSRGVEPSAVVGHSQGEIAAAVVAGGLSLSDGARLVALRSRAIRALSGHGGMASLAVSVARTQELIAPWADRISTAAVNGPSATVVAGDPQALRELVEACEAREVRARIIPVDYASHSVHVEAVREEILAELADLAPRPAQIPFRSTVTAEDLDTSTLDAEYWYSNLRRTVRFEEAVRGLADEGCTVFVEMSPHPVLSLGIQEVLGDRGIALGTLERGQGGLDRFLAAAAQVWAAGGEVDWAALLAHHGPSRTDLPTTVFRHERYWLRRGPVGTNARGLGLDEVTHPLVGARLDLENGDTLHTGRVSADTLPWLADHAVHGTVLLPGTAFVEIALTIGDLLDTPDLRDLTLEAPLAVPEKGAVQIRATAEAPGPDGHRTLVIRGRAEGADPDAPWQRHATAVLTPRGPAPRPASAALTTGSWPPSGTAPLPPVDYEALAVRGYDYGPAFQGLSRAWRHGRDVLAEVALPTGTATDGYRLHPALLDAALHAALGSGLVPDEGTLLPFAWSDVVCRRTGSGALRVRLSQVTDGSLRLEAVDHEGTLVLSAATVAFRSARVPAPGEGALYRLDWRAAEPMAAGLPEAAEIVVLGPSPLAGLRHQPDLDAALAEKPRIVVAVCPHKAPDAPAESGHRNARWALDLVQTWLADERTAGIRLVVLTRAALAVAADEQPDLGASTVWGLFRSAQTEFPGRFALVDRDDVELSAAELAGVLRSDEPQLALRGGTALVPRLTRVDPSPAPGISGPPAATDVAKALAAGTVLVTGGLGALGRLLSRHLVTEQGVRHLLLLSRRGAEDPTAAHAIAELAELGATAEVTACDAADRTRLAAVLAAIPADRPLTGVVHAAGVLDDATLTELSSAQLRRVLTPKLDAAVHLDELTRDQPLRAFVLFSSIAGVIGNAGQANYAAANTFLDALAARRRAQGLPATALAWGLWEERGAMTGHLSDALLARLDRAGIAPLSSAEGLALFDAALAATSEGEHSEALLVAARLNLGALRGHAGAGTLNPLLRGLVRTPGRAPASPASGAGFADRIRQLPEEERHSAVLDLVRAQVAQVLGFTSADGVAHGQPFKQIGFDSLTALQLRNRLNAATGLALPATLVFDHPTPELVADRVLADLVTPSASEPSPVTSARELPEDDDPVVVVGMGCRLPGGVVSPEGLWELVSAGGDAIEGFPSDRGWDLEGLFDPDPERSGTSYVREGGFLRGAGDFDARFFGISPREALAMDPQQRLLLEVSWEALERAGIAPDSLRGSDTGVFTGLMYHDYGSSGRIPAEVEGHFLTGTTGSVASGRISYLLGMQGPALTVDTACSSSLVAMHLAVQSLRRGECSLALAGAAAVMASPNTFVEFSRQRGLAPDGRCKPFAAGADGTAWSEGVGVLVLERLSDARRAGHSVLAVVAGTAVNQDGASNGLTAPHGPSQERVIRSALADAGWDAGSVDVVEAHGTGTRLGDPIEAQALLRTYGQGRGVERPLWLGSLKSNIGHAQAAAGVAGVIKTVMAMRHGVLAPTVHVDAPTPHVDWSQGQVRLLTEAREWPATTDRPRRAGVSSFGISGTNAHVLLEEPPQAPRTDEEVPSARLLTLSAKTPTALGALLAGSLSALDGLDDAALARFCRTANSGRAALSHRAALVASGTEEMRDRLAELVAGEGDSQGARTGQVRPGGAPGVAFLFTGQGAQYPGMARGLYEEQPVFRDALDRCDTVLRPLLGRPLTEILEYTDPGAAYAGALHETRLTQPALFAVEFGLAELWRSWGVEPAAVLGHSIGELVAACVAGVLSLEDGLRLAVERGRLMQELCPAGAMAAVQAPLAVVQDALTRYVDRLSVAAVNGPESITVSGSEDALVELTEELTERGIRCRRLQVTRGFHSVLMDPMLDAFEREAARLTFRTPAVPLVSNVTGRPFTGDETLSAAYLRAHVREPVAFHQGMTTLLEAGHRLFLEVGPMATLTGMARRFATAPDSARPVRFHPSLQQGRDDMKALLDSAGALWTQGVPVDLGKVSGPRRAADWAPVPTYPFEHRRYWLLPAAPAVTVPPPVTAEPEPAEVAAPGPVLRAEIDAASAGDRPALVADRVARIAARCLGLDPAGLEREVPLQNLGLDSMLALEVRTRITETLGVEVPLAALLDGGSVDMLAAAVLEDWDTSVAEARGLDLEGSPA
ncbi:type I polyketide synthase [Streptomyces sp. NPDC001668]|uniref:type I polyketide synthase n=2 Tax=Streptomyces TaxID=1883 RepID=UPI0036B3B50F